jgi:hypothetical protein
MITRFDTTPRLAFMSPEKESGKTRALEVTSLLVPGPILSISASPAVIVRLVSKGGHTILYDEIDAVFGNSKVQEANLDLRSVLNGGYRRGAKVHRCTTNGKIVGTEELNAFAPVAVAGLRSLPDTLASRSIFIHMRRRAPDEEISQFRLRHAGQEAKPILEELTEWCGERNAGPVEPNLPYSITDRAADCWEPLLVVADEAGGDWSKRAREAAVYLTGAAKDESMTSGVELLSHIREAFGNETRIATTALLERLCDRDESPWADIYGKPLNDRGLARRLRPYGVKSRDVAVSGKCLKGYAAESFYDVWNRYLPACALPKGDEGDKRDKIDNKNKIIADIADIADREAKDSQDGPRKLNGREKLQGITCRACDGKGCPTCMPKQFGIGL